MNGLLCLLAGGLIATTSTLATADPGDSIIPDDNALSHEHVPNALFLRFKADIPQLASEDLLGQVGGTIRQSFWLVPGLVSIDTKLPVADALALLAQRDDVLQYVEPIYIVHMHLKRPPTIQVTHSSTACRRFAPTLHGTTTLATKTS